MNAFRADFDHPGAAVHHASSPSSAPNQCLAWTLWPARNRWACRTAARLGRGRPRREDDQRRVGGPQVGGLGGRVLVPLLVEDRGDVVHVDRVDAVRKLREVFGLADRELGIRGRDPVREVRASQLRVAGQGDRTEAKAGEHREHPLRPVPDQRHHHVPAPDAARRQRAREPGAASRQLAEVPDPAPAVAVDRDEARLRRRKALEHVLYEVHRRGILPECDSAPGWPSGL